MANSKTKRTWSAVWDKLQNLVGFNGAENPFGSIVTRVDEPLSLYVDAAGNDNNPGTLSEPFLTIQKALDSLEHLEIASAVTINVGPGTFAGFVIGNTIKIKSVSTQLLSTASVTIVGTLDTATGVTSASGTSTSTATGIVNDTNQNWVVNELKGKIVRVLSSGVSFEGYIQANTATQITFVGSITPTSGTVYTILEHKTKLTQTVNTAGSLKSCIVLSGGGDSGTATVAATIKWLSCDTTGTAISGGLVTSVGISANSYNFVTCNFNLDTAGSVTTAITVGNGNIISFTTCRFTTNKASSSLLNFSKDSTLTLTRCWLAGSGVSSQTAIIQNLGASMILQSGQAANLFESFGTVLLTSSTATSSNVLVGGFLMGTFINNTTVCNAYGDVYLFESKTNVPNWPFTSAGNTNFVIARGGTIVGISSSIPSGLATNDITMSSANPVAIYTLAAMRALTPQAVTDTISTVVGTMGTVG